MVIVMGTATFAPGKIDRLLGALQAQLTATRAEDGCLHYAFSRDVLDLDRLHVAERWRDNDAIDAHFKTAHIASFTQALAAAKPITLIVKAYDADGVRTLMGSDPIKKTKAAAIWGRMRRLGVFATR
jgi:quinol monooxygenase YgiN